MMVRFIAFITKIVLFLVVCLTPVFLFTKPWGVYVFLFFMIALIAWCLWIAFDIKLTKQQKWDKLLGNTY